MISSSRFQTFRRDLSEMPPGRRRLLIAALVASCLIFVAGFSVSIYLWHLARQFPQAPFAQPSRLYGRPTQLVPGEPLSTSELVAELRQAGYREDESKGDRLPLRRGMFRRHDNVVEVHVRPFMTPEGPRGGYPVEVEIRGGKVGTLTVAGRPADGAMLEPPLLASFYGPEVNERRPVTLDELPEHVVRAVLAAEDDSFFLHPGISPTGIARALWVNLNGGQMQGGSTITQQLVKNLYLSSERTLERKAKEAVIAVMLEVRYGKKAILEAYLNNIYWGRSGPANVIGIGAAARAWFGKDAAELNLEEAATLAAMIAAPGDYSPVSDQNEVIDRRNWVLSRMAELGWASQARARRAATSPLIPDPQEVDPRQMAPWFVHHARQEAQERFGVEELADQGYLLFSTLSWREQRRAEAAVAQGLASLEKGWERRRRSKGPLQAALVSVDPRNGAILAWVGGRDYGESQFDRVAQARRQAGSTFKPVVYAAAFREAVANPATILRDSPIVVKTRSGSWRPQNNDRGFRGYVTARSALEQSLNIPTVRLALQVGLHGVADTARDLGMEQAVDREVEEVPALALGAFEVSPLELVEVYSTLANDGARPTLHGLDTVLDRFGEPVLDDEEELPAPKRVMEPQAAYLVTSMLQGVVDRGTGAGVRRFGIRDPIAGKTGTTNDRRDSWFAGYTPDRATVVWVGYDDNAETQLSGARAALPIWSRFTAAVRPAEGFLPFTPPPGIVQVTIDPLTGQLATPYCPYKVNEQLADWQVPHEPCHRHSPGYGGSETWADVNLNGAPIDPVTGQPLNQGWDPATEYGIDPGGFDTNMPLEPGMAFAPEPVTIDPEAVDTTVAADGGILIRPARQEGEEEPAVPANAPINTEPLGTAGAAPAPARPAPIGPVAEEPAAPVATEEPTQELGVAPPPEPPPPAPTPSLPGGAGEGAPAPDNV